MYHRRDARALRERRILLRYFLLARTACRLRWVYDTLSDPMGFGQLSPIALIASAEQTIAQSEDGFGSVDGPAYLGLLQMIELVSGQSSAATRQI